MKIYSFYSKLNLLKGPFRKHYWGMDVFRSSPPTEDWLNLRTPLQGMKNLGTYMYIFLNNISFCVLWPYLSYDKYFDN